MLSGRWWQALYPGIAIMLTILSLNLIAENLTKIFTANNKPTTKKSVSEISKVKQNNIKSDVSYKLQEQFLNKYLTISKESTEKRTDIKGVKLDSDILLQVKNLCIKFPVYGDVDVVQNVNFHLRSGSTLAIVGESGCGKSLISLAIMGLSDNNAKITGEINFDGTNLVGLNKKQMRAYQFRQIAMIYQDPQSALNPSMLIKNQLKQLIKHGGK